MPLGEFQENLHLHQGVPLILQHFTHLRSGRCRQGAIGFYPWGSPRPQRPPRAMWLQIPRCS